MVRPGGNCAKPNGFLELERCGWNGMARSGEIGGAGVTRLEHSMLDWHNPDLASLAACVVRAPNSKACVPSSWEVSVEAHAATKGCHYCRKS